MTFEALGLKRPILEALHAQGYETPTPIQQQAIPAIMKGSDVVGLAQTGTGKTAAFLLPLLHQISGDSRPRSSGEARVLILSPTRELAAQIFKGAKDYGRKLATKAACVVGGISIKPQIRTLASGVDVLVATPGRLEDLVKQGAVELSTVEAVVLDEADQMLDIGFMPAIRRILAKCTNSRQTLLFSATMPKEIRQLAAQYLKNPVEVAVAPVSATADRIRQSVMHVNQDVKIAALIHVLHQHADRRVIIFTRTKRGADKVVRRLKHEKLEAAAIHGNKSQNQREKTLEAFREGTCPVLIATDIAARGIDVRNVELVINHDLPHVAEVYVHRIGRTARAGASGLAITLCTPDERELLKRVERLIKNTIPVIPSPEGLTAPKALPKLPPRQRNTGARPAGKKAKPARAARGKSRKRRADASPQGKTAENAGTPGKEGKAGTPKPAKPFRKRRKRR